MQEQCGVYEFIISLALSSTLALLVRYRFGPSGLQISQTPHCDQITTGVLYNIVLVYSYTTVTSALPNINVRVIRPKSGCVYTGRAQVHIVLLLCKLT